MFRRKFFFCKHSIISNAPSARMLHPSGSMGPCTLRPYGVYLTQCVTAAEFLCPLHIHSVPLLGLREKQGPLANVDLWPLLIFFIITLDSISNGADPMMEWYFLFSSSERSEVVTIKLCA